MSSGPLAPPLFLAHLRADAPPIRQPKGRPLVCTDELVHRAAFEADPELYALSAIATRVTREQRGRA